MLAEQPDLLAVGGGYGIISCAAGRVTGTDVTLGVISLGTANDFSRTMEIPVRPQRVGGRPGRREGGRRGPRPGRRTGLPRRRLDRAVHEPLELHDLLQVAVGNGRHYGGGNTVSPTASLDDHLLDVYAIERGRLRDHVPIARFLKDGSFVEHENVRHLTTLRIRVSTDPELPVNLDGGCEEHPRRLPRRAQRPARRRTRGERSGRPRRRPL